MRRRLAWAAAAALVVVVVSLGVLWVWQPWVPPIVLADPGPGGRRVDAAGLFGDYYPAVDPSGAVLVLGGSEGGLSRSTARTAKALQQQGYTALALAYFGGPGQPRNLERIPLETFDRALAWLAAQPGVPGGRLAVMGTSKGAEAALVLGVRHPELRAVVAASPSSAVWPGIIWDSPNGLNAGSSWTDGGRELPFLPYASFKLSVLTGHLGRLYRDAVDRLPTHPRAAIPIERTDGAVLLICGEQDRLWPSCPMARQLRARAGAAGRPTVQVLAYDGVGHADVGPAYPGVGPTSRWGGTARAANGARAASWAVVLDFLHAHLGVGHA